MPWSPQKINPMLSSDKSLTKLLQRFFAVLICLDFISSFTQPTFAIDGQLLVIEAWNLVNSGYYDLKFDEIQWKRLRQKALKSQ